MMKKVLSLVGFVILSSFPIPAAANDVAEETDTARIKETIIFIPAREMKSILGIEKEGVFVTYDEYKTLYEKAKNEYIQKEPRALILPGAQGPVIIQANYSGVIIGELLQFEARFKIVQNKKGPSLLDFPLKGVRYQSARLNGKNVQIYQQDREPRIIIPGAGSHVLVVEFLLPVTFAEKKGFVSFDCPPAILGSIRITSDLFYEIKLKDLLFTSRRQIEAKTEFVGYIGSKSALSLEITNRRSFGEKRVKISSRETHQVFVDRDIINHKTDFHLTVRDGELKGVSIEIGKKDHVYSLAGSGISGWTREDLGEKSILHCTFHVPLTNQSKFTLKTYTYNEPGARSFSLEDTLIQGLFEREGDLFVFYAKNTRIKTEDVRFLGPIQKPTAISKVRPGYTLHRGYGLFNLPYTLGYSFQEMPSRVTCNQLSHVSIERSKVHFRSENRLYGLQPGSTRFVFSFPDGYRLQDVVALINGKKVKEYHDLAVGQNLLTITITNPVSAKDEVAFIVKSELSLNEDLLKKGPFTIEIPVVSYTRAGRMTGNLQLSIADRYLLEAMTMDGYSPSKEISGLDPPAESRNRQRLIYDFRTISPRGALTLSYRKGEQTSNTVNYIAVDQDILQASAYIHYVISGGSRASFYFALPRWENSKINIVGANIKEKKKVDFDKLNAAVAAATPSDLKDLDIWHVILQEEVQGDYLLSVDYQKKIEDYGAFSDVPLVMPVGVGNDTGHIVMEAGRDTEIKAKKTGLNEVEIHEIPEWPSYKPSNRIIESLRYFSRPFTFEIAVVRRDESPVLAALAEQETITYTLGKNSDVFFEFDYKVKNTNLQFLEIRLPGDHILWSATLQGKGIKPRKGKGNRLLFPLASGDATINLRLTGYVPTKTKWRIWKSFEISSPALPIPSMRSHVRVFYPKDYFLFSQKGNFERWPEPSGQGPLVVSFFQRLISTFNAGMRPLSFLYFSPRAQKIAAPAPPMEESERAPRSIEKKDDVAGERKRERYDRPSESQALAPPGRLPQQAPEIAGVSSDQYFRKKGILAMYIDIPKEGDLLPADKLWGESQLRVRFLSAGWKRALAIFTTLLVIALGFYLTRKGIMTPAGFLITTLVLFTFLPMIILKSLVFIFDGAVIGALVFAAVSFTWAMIKKSESKKGARVGLVFLCVMAAYLFFAFNDALAASESPFPDIEIYVPYEEQIPFDVDGTQKVFIPTKDYFLLKFMADPPYRPAKMFEYENEYDITGFDVKGNVEGSMVRFTALLDVFVNTDKWALIELPFANVFIAALTLDNEQIPVRIGGGATKKNPSFAGERVIYEIPVQGFGRHSLAIDFYVEVEAFAGKKTIAFGFPEALCTDFSLTMQDRDVLLKFEEPRDGYYTKNIAEGILTRASLSEKSFVKISWFPKKYIKKTERPLVYADSEINMFVDYEEVLVSQNAKIRVEKSALASLLFHKHPELVIVDVLSDKVKNWGSLNQNGKTMIEVTFKNEITETVELLVRAKMKWTPAAPLPVVFLEPVDAERFRGNLNLYGLDDYRLLVRDIKGLKISDTGTRHWQEFPGFELQKSYSFTGSAFQAEIVNMPLKR